MKKILIISPGFSANEHDTSCLPYLQDYVLALRDVVGAENITIVTTQYPYTKKNYRWHDITVHPSGGANKKGFYYYFTMRRTLKKIMQLLDNGNYILHAFWMGEAAFVAQRAAKSTGAPLVINLMGQDARAGNRTMRYIDTDYAHIIAISQHQADAFYDAYGIAVDKVLPLPVPEISTDPNTVRDIDVLFVGSMIAVKNPMAWIAVISRLKADFPALRAYMAGDGPLMPEVRAGIAEQHLGDTITLGGNLTREAVFALMQRSKILLHTSQYEGQCHSFAEALAHGMYVVSNNVGRIEDTPKHMVADSEEEMNTFLATLLKNQLDFTPVKTLNELQVVQLYIEKYQELSKQ